MVPAELLAKANEAYMAGLRLANVAFNITQEDEPPNAEAWGIWKKMLKESQLDWDKGAAELNRVLIVMQRTLPAEQRSEGGG